MAHEDEINAHDAKIEAKRDCDVLAEAANVLAKITAHTKLIGLKNSEFTCLRATRYKRGSELAVKNAN
jgi:hypothetical protein